MASYNKIILVGNLTSDPQLKYLPSQTAVAEFRLAVNHKYRTKSGEDREEVCFVDCSVFGRGAEVINQYCQKGKPLLVEGRLKYETWEDKQGGGKRSKHSVFVDNFQLLSSRDGGGAGGGNYDAGGSQDDQRPPHRTASSPQRAPAQGQNKPAPEQPFGEEKQFNEDDIPF